VMAMFVEGTLKKTSLLLTLAVLPLLFGYFFVSLILFTVIAFFLQFFRDPNREIPSEEGVVVAPADGRILEGKIDLIKTVKYEDPLMEHILDEGGVGILVSTFMSPFDVHVNRVPISGKIVHTEYHPGKFKIAWRKVNKESEKNLIVIDSEYGRVGVVQIAGFVARRIVQYVNVGDTVNIGDRLGMIRFGSRVDLILSSQNWGLLVAEGQKSKAGETIIARIIKNSY
jgi:phosphatidylserine decarboxylase